MFSLLWCLFGILSGVLFGVIPGAGTNPKIVDPMGKAS